MPANEKFCCNYAESLAVPFALNYEKPNFLKVVWSKLFDLFVGLLLYYYDCGHGDTEGI